MSPTRNQCKAAKRISGRTFTIKQPLHRGVAWTYTEVRRIMRTDDYSPTKPY
jgi:hypothetical protein